MKNVYHGRYFNIDLYFSGFMLGAYYDHESNELIVVFPFVAFEIKLYNFFQK